VNIAEFHSMSVAMATELQFHHHIIKNSQINRELKDCLSLLLFDIAT
jgi:hypothetical protein